MALMLDNPTLLQSVLAMAPLGDLDVTLNFVLSTGVIEVSNAALLEEVVRLELARGEITGPQPSLRIGVRLQHVVTTTGRQVDPGHARGRELWRGFLARGGPRLVRPGAAGPQREPINDALDEALFNDFADATAWSVYADWWLERGEPRGELVRLALMQPRDLIAEGKLRDASWKRWFGSLALQHVTELVNGFARALELPDDADLRVLAAFPALRFLRRLAVLSGFSGSLHGVSGFRALAELELTNASPEVNAQLQQSELPALERLGLVRLGAHGERDVAVAFALRAPRLRALSFALHGAPMERVLTQALAWPGLAKLAELDLLGLTPPDAARLLAHRGRFTHLRLSLAADADTLASLRADLRAAFPRARLAPHLPLSTADFRLWPPPEVRTAPRHAPADFRRLPARVELASRRDEYAELDRWHGSGEPCGENDLVRRCLACASSDVLCIYGERSETYSSAESETYRDDTRELACQECGQFSSYRTFVTR